MSVFIREGKRKGNCKVSSFPSVGMMRGNALIKSVKKCIVSAPPTLFPQDVLSSIMPLLIS